MLLIGIIKWFVIVVIQFMSGKNLFMTTNNIVLFVQSLRNSDSLPKFPYSNMNSKIIQNKSTQSLKSSCESALYVHE